MKTRDLTKKSKHGIKILEGKEQQTKEDKMADIIEEYLENVLEPPSWSKFRWVFNYFTEDENAWYEFLPGINGVDLAFLILLARKHRKTFTFPTHPTLQRLVSALDLENKEIDTERIKKDKDAFLTYLLTNFNLRRLKEWRENESLIVEYLSNPEDKETFPFLSLIKDNGGIKQASKVLVSIYEFGKDYDTGYKPEEWVPKILKRYGEAPFIENVFMTYFSGYGGMDVFADVLWHMRTHRELERRMVEFLKMRYCNDFIQCLERGTFKYYYEYTLSNAWCFFKRHPEYLRDDAIHELCDAITELFKKGTFLYFLEKPPREVYEVFKEDERKEIWDEYVVPMFRDLAARLVKGKEDLIKKSDLVKAIEGILKIEHHTEK